MVAATFPGKLFVVPGTYRFIFVTEPTLLPEPERQESHVELYWGVIGLFSQILGLNPEALTIVILAHELAHAYTHRAADIDGKFWDSQGFGRTDLAVVGKHHMNPTIPSTKCGT